MFDDLSKELKYQIKAGGFWIQSIIANVAIFIIVNISNSYESFSHSTHETTSNSILKYLSLSSNLHFDIFHPWVWITHIFTHQSVFHLLWNMLNLYWFSLIVQDLIGRKHAITIFFESGILGGIFFLMASSLLPWSSHQDVIAYGASASVMGLLFAAATISPNYELTLLFIGRVAIKYIAVAFLVLDLLFVGQTQNSGGHAAHIGGALMGYMYIILLRHGYRLSPIDWFTKRKTRQKRISSTSQNLLSGVSVKNKNTTDPELRMNQILDKIKQSGIQSLNMDEKNFLDQFSGK